MQEVAKDLRELNEARQSVKSRKSVFDTTNIVQKEAAQRCFEDLASFSKLRDPLEWNTRGLAESTSEAKGENVISQIQSMLQYSSDPIMTSLTTLSTGLCEAAVTNFHDLMRCMGDKAHATHFVGEDMQEPILTAAKKN